MDIIKAHAVKNLCYSAAKKMKPQGIVVHSTGANNPNLKRYVDSPDAVGVNKYANHWNVAKPGGSKICVHAFIGYDINKNVRVAEILPLDICCWGVGKGKKGSYNYDPAYIQFEICEDSLTDRAYYTKAFDVAAEYCAHLCRTYGIAPDKIVGHCEAHKQGYGSNHSDPEHWMKRFGESMDDFRKKVVAVLNGTCEQAEPEQPSVPDKKDGANCPYLVKVTANALNIRKGSGTNTRRTGVITDKGVYTIVEEADGIGATRWGRLKSGAGWISLDYVKRV